MTSKKKKKNKAANSEQWIWRLLVLIALVGLDGSDDFGTVLDSHANDIKFAFPPTGVVSAPT